MNFDGFIEFMIIKQGLSRNSVESYVSDISQFMKYSKNRIDNELIGDYIFLSMKTKKAATINRFTAALSNFKEWKKTIGERADFDLPKNIKIPRLLPEFIGFDKIQDALNLQIATNIEQRNKLLFLVIYSTGIRVSEAVNLKISALHIEDSFISVFGKGNKQRAIPLNAKIIDYIERYMKECRQQILKGNTSIYLFVGRNGKLTRQMAWRIIKDIGLKLQIDRPHPHLLRHSFATHLILGGADIRIIETMLGHKNLDTTTIYTHIPDSHLLLDFKKHHPREK